MKQKNTLGTLLSLTLLATVLCSCGTYSPVTVGPRGPQDVRIQLMGSREWVGVVAVTTGTAWSSVAKPEYDTTEFNIGRLEPGTTFTLRTGQGRYEYFKAPDSIRVVVGTDTTITYYPEGLEAVYVVR